jgi:serine/threonine protein kinase
MSLFRAFVKSLVKNVGKYVGNYASGLLGVPIAGDILVGTWEIWEKESADEQQRKAEIEAYARQAIKDALPEALEAVRLEAPLLPEPQRQLIVDYLCQVPATIQRSLRRPEDRSGRSVPPGLPLRNANDLLPLLPPTLPRFRAGDALPGKPGWLLDRQLGVGGFGEVWLARKTGYGSLVGAVKFCHKLQTRDRDMLHESKVIDRLLSQVKDPIVVPLLDVHLDGEAPWLMYEYVEGGDLGDLIRHWTKLPSVERQLKVVMALQRLAKTVGRFHRLDHPIIHRDLKPANILYDKKERQLRITDFGIGGIAARDMIEGEKLGTWTGAGRLQSYLYGSYTPLYASPQQKAGDPPDPRDDVHALGVIAYQMLTCQMTQGVGPDFIHDLTERAVEQGLIDLVGRCCSQRADRRPKDAGEIAESLAKLNAANKSSPPPSVDQRQPVTTEEVPEVSDVVTRTWDRDSMKSEMIADGASRVEIEAFDKIFDWGQRRGRCEFGKPQKPSVTIKIPTFGQEVQILNIRGRQLRFYWVHFVGAKESGNKAGRHVDGKFPNAYALVEWFCQSLNEVFNWTLKVASDKGGFLEPTRPLTDIAEPNRLEAFLDILTRVADSALLSQVPQPPTKKNAPPAPTTLTKTDGLTFDEVIAAIRQLEPNAGMGSTADGGPYYEKACRLTNYEMFEGDPLRYGAMQSNGRMMWLYLGRGKKICCGDKAWD